MSKLIKLHDCEIILVHNYQNYKSYSINKILVLKDGYCYLLNLSTGTIELNSVGIFHSLAIDAEVIEGTSAKTVLIEYGISPRILSLEIDGLQPIAI